VTTSTAVTDLNWHHVSGVYDMVAGQSRIYLDGVLRGSASTSGTPRTGTDPLLLGTRMSSSLKDWFKGRIDLVQVYSGAVHTDNFTPPTTLGSTHGAGYVTLHWTLPEIGLVRGYNLYRQAYGNLPWRLNRTALITETTYTDDMPFPGNDCYFVRAVNARGVEGLSTQEECVVFSQGEVPSDATAPAARGLGLRVAPNPFNPATRIAFHLEHAGDVQLTLFDVAGRRVRAWSLAGLPAGEHQLPLLAEEHGKRLASGLYVLRLEAGGASARARVVLLK
jgi:hypothetical protein